MVQVSVLQCPTMKVAFLLVAMTLVATQVALAVRLELTAQQTDPVRAPGLFFLSR